MESKNFYYNFLFTQKNIEAIVVNLSLLVQINNKFPDAYKNISNTIFSTEKYKFRSE